MAKKFLKTLMFSLSIGLVLSGCGNKAGEEKDEEKEEETPEKISSNWDVIPENTNQNFKYFGFYHPDGFVSEPSMLEEIDSLDFCNFYILNGGVSTATLLERLAFVSLKNSRCTVSIPSRIFNESETETYGIGKLKSLKPNWKEIFKEYADSIQQYIDDGTIYAFYTDEPAWNGIKEAEFVTVTKWLSEEYPHVGRMACFSCPEVGIKVDKRLPELEPTYFDYLTDVSYDNYADWNDETRLSFLNKLKSKARKNQWIWGTPKTFESNPEFVNSIIGHLKGMYTEAIQDKRYRGISCFSWSNGFDGDWDYGAKSFLLETSSYYSREVHKLMSDIGRTIQHKERIDWSQIPIVTLTAPYSVYNIGEKVYLPSYGATDANGNDIDVSFSLTSPCGSQIDVSKGYFIPEESGDYTFTVEAGEGTQRKSLQCPISIRYNGEISLFENSSYNGDTSGSQDSIWCWPRNVVTDFARSGTGCLKVMPHEKDGTWPNLNFNRDGNLLWDISTYEKVSLWVYNPSDEPLNGLGLIFRNEYQEKDSYVYAIKNIPSNEWTNIVAEVDTIAGNELIDVSKVEILFGNCADDYKNRTPFYIDDVMLLGTRKEVVEEEGATIGFESVKELEKLPTPTESDAWCWPRGISSEQAHGGNRSLKVTPHPTDGTWAHLDFGEYDLTTIGKVQLWLYFDGEESFPFMGLMLKSGSGDPYTYFKTIAPKTWTLYEVDVNTAEPYLDDISKVDIFVGNIGSDYEDRSPWYFDTFVLVEGRDTPDEDLVSLYNFDSPEKCALLPTPTDDDAWCWPRAFSAEQKHDGIGSLKITPHPTDGQWAHVDFGNFNLTGKKAVEFWVYFDSANDYDYFGVLINNDKLQIATPVISRTWVKFSIEVSLIETKVTDLTNVNIMFGNLGGTYPDRSPIFIDSFNITTND